MSDLLHLAPRDQALWGDVKAEGWLVSPDEGREPPRQRRTSALADRFGGSIAFGLGLCAGTVLSGVILLIATS